MSEENPSSAPETTTNIPLSEGQKDVATHGHGEDVNVAIVGLVGVFAAVGLFLIVVLLQAWFYSAMQTERDNKVVPFNDASTAFGQMKAEQKQQLETYHWIKPETQTRAIPIDRAMDLVVAEMAGSGQRKK